MNAGKFETALTNLIGVPAKEWTTTHIALLTAAAEVDRLRNQLAADSAYLARKFDDYASEVRTRVNFSDTPPTYYSAISDVTANAKALQVARDSLLTLVSVVLGKEARKQLLAAASD